jgi:hypothetical protein
MFQKNLALDLLDLYGPSPWNAPKVGGRSVRGKALRQEDTKPFSARNSTSDTEGYTTRSGIVSDSSFWQEL